MRQRASFHTLLLLVLCCGMALPGVGCRQQSAVKEGSTQISFAIHANNEGAALVKECIREFEQQNPAIRVKLVHIVSKYEQVLLTMLAGGRGPDVFMMNPHVMESYVSKGILLPLDNFIRGSQKIALENYFPQTVVAYRFNGERFGEGPLYGLCKDWSPDRLVFYNKKLFDEAGLPYPSPDWTWPEFLETAQRLTKRDARGRVIQFGVYNNCEPEQWINQAGGRVYSEDNRLALLDSPQALDGLRFCAELITKHRVAPGKSDSGTAGSENAMFESGRVAMVFYGMWITPILMQNIRNFDWGVVTPPRFRRDVYTCMAMVGYGINARTPHREAAWKFFEFMAGPDGQRKHALKGWNIPSDRNIAYGPEFRGNPNLPRDVVETFLSALDRTQIVQINPLLMRGEYDQFFIPEWDLVLLGEKTPEEAMRTVTRNLNQAIRDNLAIQEAGANE